MSGCKVRWSIKLPGDWGEFHAGEKVDATDFSDLKEVQLGSNKFSVEGAVKTADGKHIPASFLELQEDKTSEIATKIAKFGQNCEDSSSGKWWYGRRSAVEAGCFLLGDAGLFDGSYIVCQPPELQPPTTKWPVFLLAVRSGSLLAGQAVQEWKDDEYYNARYGELHQKRDLFHMEVLPQPPEGPPPGVVFFIIQRNDTGYFYLENATVFPSINKLLEHYHSHLLPIKMQADFRKQMPQYLEEAAPANVDGLASPAPMICQYKCPGWKQASCKMILSTERSLKKLVIKLNMNKLSEEQEGRELLQRAYLNLNGDFNQIVIRKLRSQRFNQKFFDLDIAKITAAGKDKNFFAPGYNFLSHIVSYGRDAPFKHWIAYTSVIGLPLDRLLKKRRYNDDFLTPRGKYEILYQVAGAMRFLEQNGLCHRHLKAGNVVVEAEEGSSMVVKVTDYMVPYHFLNYDNITNLSLADLDWPWWAPEVVKYRCFDILTDIWAFGCFTFEVMHYGMVPYTFEKPPLEKPQELAVFLMKDRKMTLIEEDELDNFVTDLMQKCMETDAAARPSFDYLFNFLRDLLFDFTKNPNDVIKKGLAECPAKFEHKFKRGKLTNIMIQKVLQEIEE